VSEAVADAVAPPRGACVHASRGTPLAALCTIFRGQPPRLVRTGGAGTRRARAHTASARTTLTLSHTKETQLTRRRHGVASMRTSCCCRPADAFIRAWARGDERHAADARHLLPCTRCGRSHASRQGSILERRRALVCSTLEAAICAHTGTHSGEAAWRVRGARGTAEIASARWLQQDPWVHTDERSMRAARRCMPDTPRQGASMEA
jgi:hypothetical protein